MTISNFCVGFVVFIGLLVITGIIHAVTYLKKS